MRNVTLIRFLLLLLLVVVLFLVYQDACPARLSSYMSALKIDVRVLGGVDSLRKERSGGFSCVL